MRIALLYLVVLLLEIYGSTAYHRPLVWITKPLLMPLLMYLAYQKGIKNKWLYVALVGSWLGDIFLMLDGQFIPGLVSFLFAHIAYILLFKPYYTFSFIPIFLLALITSAYLIFLLPHIPLEMKWPVITYCSVITGMGIMASSLDLKSKKWITLGALLFILSDSLIAYNKFYVSLPYSAFFIMGTYGAAQYLILKGWSKKDFA
jgi:alkylglycerol monooxygenase